MRAFFLAVLLAASLASPGRAGEVGSTLGKYSAAGAGVGALLGTAAATIPYLQSKQSYDFLTGAGIGLLSGSVIGFILGMVDLANPAPEQARAPQVEGLVLSFTPAQAQVAWIKVF